MAQTPPQQTAPNYMTGQTSPQQMPGPQVQPPQTSPYSSNPVHGAQAQYQTQYRYPSPQPSTGLTQWQQSGQPTVSSTPYAGRSSPTHHQMTGYQPQPRQTWQATPVYQGQTPQTYPPSQPPIYAPQPVVTQTPYAAQPRETVVVVHQSDHKETNEGGTQCLRMAQLIICCFFGFIFGVTTAGIFLYPDKFDKFDRSGLSNDAAGAVVLFHFLVFSSGILAVIFNSVILQFIHALGSIALFWLFCYPIIPILLAIRMSSDSGDRESSVRRQFVAQPQPQPQPQPQVVRVVV